MGIKENLERIRKEIGISSERSGTKEVVVVGISKTFPLVRIKEAIEFGLKDIGENRIQEAETKFPSLSNVRKHFVGHLQSNKVKKAIEIFDMIQSVDSIKLARKISDRSLDLRRRTPVLIEVLTDENKQFGVRPEELEDFLKEVSIFKGIRVQGLMTIGPYFENPEDSRKIFRKMKSLFEKMRNLPDIEMRYLSMGMSDDFRIAVEEGANMVRIGRGIFGERV
ncbi:MAG: YggS family pyridoxal phosphate-dependent enzyme [Candidatus Aenigmatarchaeota archaeon]|nr:MAG: YggS family pyridoxal phosphate-dependent enzyme [Candidatus Aenigmarchaeota archaeon]